MTAVDSLASGTSTHRIARIISDVLSPIVALPACTFVVSIHDSTTWLSGLTHGAIAVFFAVAFPYAVLLSWVRSGRLADREVRDRAQRPAIMLITLASVSLGLAALWFLHVPRDLFAHMAAMVAGLALTLAVTSRWKISLHTACLAGAIASVFILVTPWVAVSTALLAPLAWTRMLLKHHSLAQTCAGVALGGTVAAVVVSYLG